MLLFVSRRSGYAPSALHKNTSLVGNSSSLRVVEALASSHSLSLFGVTSAMIYRPVYDARADASPVPLEATAEQMQQLLQRQNCMICAVLSSASKHLLSRCPDHGRFVRADGK